MLEEVLSKLSVRKNYEEKLWCMAAHNPGVGKTQKTQHVCRRCLAFSYIRGLMSLFCAQRHHTSPISPQHAGRVFRIMDNDGNSRLKHTSSRHAGRQGWRLQIHNDTATVRNTSYKIYSWDSKLAKQFSSTCSLYDHDRNVPHMPLSYSKILTSPWLFVLRAGAGAWSFRWAVWLVAYHLHVAE